MISIFKNRLGVLLLPALLSLGLPAAASRLFGVSDFVNATANDACAANGTYTTSAGVSGPTIANFGNGPSNEGYRNCRTAFSSPSALGLTSASVQANAFDTTLNDSFGHSASAAAASGLATASLHGSSTSAANQFFQGTGSASTDSELWDELTFSIPGATSTTVTGIPVFFSVDGSNTYATEEVWGASLEFSSGGCFFCPGNANQVTWEDDVNGFIFSGNIGLASGTFTPVSDPFPDSITWLTPLVNTSNDLVEEGILSLTGPTAVVDLSANLDTRSNAGAVNYTNTAGISLRLPAGVTYISASNTFAGATAPEPAAFGLCGAGLLLLLGVRRRGSPRHLSSLSPSLKT